MADQATLRDPWGNLAVTVSCKAIVHDDSDKIWLRKNERDDWELPGGRLNEDEQPEEAVMREIGEELGLTAKNIVLVDVYIWKVDFGKTTHIELVTFACRAGNRIGNFEHIGETGKSEFRQFTIEDAMNLNNLPDPYKRALKLYENH